eukprot:ANDGO_04184.mRNA.1 hypothetical protein CAOG_00259
MKNAAVAVVISLVSVLVLCVEGKVPFACKPLAPRSSPATSVWDLRADDIRVIGTLGDSISAGFAMHDHFLVDGLWEYRADAFTVGGNPGATTVPNFLKAVSQDGKLPFGAPEQCTLPFDAIKWKDKIIQPYDPVSLGDVAQSMAKIAALPAQVDYLYGFMKNHSHDFDMQKDWKMINVLIGANDLCVSCDPGRQDITPEAFQQKYDNVLTLLNQNIPRAFVNIMTLFNVSQVQRLAQKSAYCMEIHKLFDECPCAIGPNSGPESWALMDAHTAAYNEKMYELEAKWAAKGLAEFGVRIQPVLENLDLPDLSYVSNLDCFHPSAKANEQMAMGLWNSFLSPVDKKPRGIDPDLKLICPDETTRLQ